MSGGNFGGNSRGGCCLSIGKYECWSLYSIAATSTNGPERAHFYCCVVNHNVSVLATLWYKIRADNLWYAPACWVAYGLSFLGAQKAWL